MCDSIQVPLTGKHGLGKFALVDSDDTQLVEGFSWYVACIRGALYVVASVRTEAGEWRQIRLHRIVMNAHDPAQFVNFKDQNPLNCTKANLRVCTPAQSVCTRAKLGHSRHRYKGVRKVGNRWYARVYANKRCFNRGGFDTETDAALDYNIAAREHFGEFARFNEVTANG